MGWNDRTENDELAGRTGGDPVPPRSSYDLADEARDREKEDEFHRADPAGDLISPEDDEALPTDGSHPRVVNALAEAMGETLGAINETNKGQLEHALESVNRALSSTEEAVRLQRSLRSVIEQRLKPGGLA